MLFFLCCWSESVHGSTEDQVEHQKRNQTVTSQWPVGFVLGVQLGYSCRLKSFQVNVLNHVVFPIPKFNTICLLLVPLLLA